MEKYYYVLSQNEWEYTGQIEVEADEKPICVCDKETDEYYLIINGAKISFNEEIREKEKASVESIPKMYEQSVGLIQGENLQVISANADL